MKKQIYMVGLSLLLLCTATAYAGGNAVFGVATAAESMGNAFTAVADDPSAVFYNPAGLTQNQRAAIQANLFYLKPVVKYTNNLSGESVKSNTGVWAPSVFANIPLPHHLHLGFGLYSPFARKTDFGQFTPPAPGAMATPLNSEFMRLDFAAVLAIPLSSRFSIGFGPIVSQVKTKFEAVGLKQKDEGYAFSGVIGALYQANSRIKLGLTFHAPEAAHNSGHGDGVYPPAFTPIDSDYTATIRTPAIVNFGIAAQLNRRLLVASSIDVEFWSYVKNIVRDYPNNPAATAATTTTINGKDSYNFHLGVRYKLFHHSELLAGYSFIGQAIPDNYIAPVAPDFDSNVLAIGYAYTRGHWHYNIGYEYAFSLHTVTNNNAMPGFPFTGQYKMHMNTFMVSGTYRF